GQVSDAFGREHHRVVVHLLEILRFISASASGTAQCAWTSTVLTRRPFTTTSRRRAWARAGAAASGSHPTNAMPASAPAPSWRNSLRVVMVVSSSLRWRIQGPQHELHPHPDPAPPSMLEHHPPALELIACYPRPVSKAFTKDEAWEEPIIPPRAPVPAGVPNYVTPRGLRLLRAELAALEVERHHLEADRSDELEYRRRLAILTGRTSELAARIASATLVDPL